MIIDKYADAREDALSYLRSRDRTSEEIRLQLKKKDHQDPIIDEVIADLEESGIISDSRYCENFIQECLGKRRGRRFIKAGLENKGIDGGLIADKLEELLDRDIERENAEAEIGKLGQNGSKPPASAKIARRLSYLGYETDLIFELVRKHNDAGD